MSTVLKPSIVRNDSQESYQIWPFQPAEVSADGDRNNGGLDLVENPDLIDRVHEATEQNGLRQLLVAMNDPGKSFKTLGCLAGEADGLYYTYIEFTPRDQSLARNEKLIVGIHRAWQDWTDENCAQHPGLADAIHQNLKWEYREFSYRGSEPQFLITMYPRARNADDHRSLISWAHNFLCSVDLEQVRVNYA
ncbi:hypothetical protein [Pseudomonas soli]|uniref:Uncharacterized protein n=1 Tax=Pseudomonas soli TaxID=1306993 RepID=A0A1H9Q5G1_9PSED|nr:hypothetical protein [Pseudomonas soli]SER55159.1 hypothetical protein SAMN05216230_10994 [Pseudomonas soli]